MNKFDYEQVEMKISEYRAIYNRMNEELTNLKNVLKTIQNGSIWQGEACEYFKESYNKLLSVAEDLSIAMQNVALYIQKISENYKRLEESISLEME